MIDRATGYHLSEKPLASSQMDKDWYYRWLLFSNLQHQQDWQQRLFSSPSSQSSPSQAFVARSMLIAEGSYNVLCGLCEADGDAVHQSPGTFPRLLQALNLSKLPPLLTEDGLRKRIGLCNKCEHKIKVLEEASASRSSLKESFICRLKKLSVSGVYNNSLSLPLRDNGAGLNNSLRSLAIQQCNEVTPQQHSMKRKISSLHPAAFSDDSLSVTTAIKRKHLLKGSNIPTHTLPISPDSVIDSPTTATNSSDEENTHHVASQFHQLSPSPPISPRSSNDSYASPAASLAHEQTGTRDAAAAYPKVLTELTSTRNRRKQARPVKAAGEVISHTNHVVKGMMTTHSTTMAGAATVSTKSLRSPSLNNDGGKRLSPSRSPLPKNPTPKPTASPYCPNVPTTIHIPTNPSSQPIPFSNSLYQSMLANQRLSVLSSTPPPTLQQHQRSTSGAHNTQSALLLAQSMYNAANGPLMALPRSIVLGGDHLGQVGGKVPLFNKTALPISVPNSSRMGSTGSNSSSMSSASVKKEPSLPLLSFSLPIQNSVTPPKMGNDGGSSSLPITATTTGGSSHSMAAEAHTLIKTDKRRYCKVCSAANRKANNGRPPQSRFLCVRCNMPMCRNCIEEHRYIVSLNSDDNTDKSASARLLQAVKMRQKASNPISKSVTKTKMSAISTTPPSTSAMLYPSLSSSPPTSAAAAAASPGAPHLAITAPFRPSPPPLSPAQTSLNAQTNNGDPDLQPISAAPSKLADDAKLPSNCGEAGPSKAPVQPAGESDQLSPSQRTGDGEELVMGDSLITEDDDDEDGRLVISELEPETDNQTEITPEMANETAAMLDENMAEISDETDAMVLESSEARNEEKSSVSPSTVISTLMTTTTSNMAVSTADPSTSSNNIPPLQHCAMVM